MLNCFDLPRNGWVISLLLITLLLGLGFRTWAVDPTEYPFLFRKKIRSKSQRYELKSVLYGRVYKVQYFFLPQVKQYLVYSNVETPKIFRNSFASGRKEYTFSFVLLDAAGNELRRFDSHERFSAKSGIFYSAHGYCDWLVSGDTLFKPYDFVLNEDLKMSQTAFNEHFKEQYQKADYVEIAYLRTSANERYEAGIIFRSEGKMGVLLSGLSDSRLYSEYTEDDKTNAWEQVFRLKMKEAQSFPLSAPSVPMLRLETDNTYPFKFFRQPFSSPFRLKKYVKEYSSGWNGVASYKGIPIYIPGEISGLSFVKAKIDGETFKFRVLEVEKFLFYYNLGLRTFKLPSAFRNEHSLTFVESVQNAGDNRIGGGTFVMKKVDGQSCENDLPEGVSEERFSQLPIPLQEALMYPKQTIHLDMNDKLTAWLPEINLLPNLQELTFSTTMTSIPNEIGQLKHLQSLSIQNSSIEKVSLGLAELPELKNLDLFSNHITQFPRELLACPRLESLKLSANKGLKELPASIVKMGHLKRLDIGMTAIETLPDEMASMKQLYIWDTANLAQRLPEKFHHLFDVYKTVDNKP